MQVQFKFKPKGAGEDTITAEIVDVIAWEEKFQRPSSQLSGDGVFVRDFIWLAWHAMFRTERTKLEFMDWAATLDEIEGDEPAPLEPSENLPATG